MRKRKLLEAGVSQEFSDRSAGPVVLVAEHQPYGSFLFPPSKPMEIDRHVAQVGHSLLMISGDPDAGPRQKLFELAHIQRVLNACQAEIRGKIV